MTFLFPQNIRFTQETRPMRFLLTQQSVIFVGAGSLMSMYRHLDQQVPLNSKIHNSLRRPNLPMQFFFPYFALRLRGYFPFYITMLFLGCFIFHLN